MKVQTLIRCFAVLLIVGTLHAGNSGPTLDVKFGTVALTFDNSFDLEALGAKLNKVIPGSYRPGKKVVTAPIVGGAYQLSDGQAEIHSSGGFKLTTETRTVSLVDFEVTIPANPADASVSALLTATGVFRGRVTLGTFDATTLNITFPVVMPPNNKLSIKNIPITLSTDSALALNTAFGLLPGTIPSGQVLGTINIGFKAAAKNL